MADIHSADFDGPAALGQFIQAVQQVHQRGFPAAGAAQDTEGAASLDRKGNVFQYRFRAFVIEIDMLKFKVAPHIRLQRIFTVLLLLLG